MQVSTLPEEKRWKKKDKLHQFFTLWRKRKTKTVVAKTLYPFALLTARGVLLQ